MSRVDLTVDGETVEQEHFNDPSDVRISFDGGDNFPLTLAEWQHVVVAVDTDRDG